MDLLESQAIEQLVFEEDLLDAGICAEFETAQEFVSPLHVDVDLVVLAEPPDLFKLSVEAIDKHQVLWLRLDKELLEGVPINACLEREVARSTLNVNLSLVGLVQECLRVLIMQVFESIVLLFMCVFFDDSGLGLLHLDAFLLVKHQFLLLFLLCGHKQLLFVDLAVEGKSGPLVDFDRTVRAIFVPVKGERREGIRRRERFAVGFL